MTKAQETKIENLIEDVRQKGVVEISPVSSAAKWGIKDKKGKFVPIYSDCTSTWCVPLSSSTGQYATGLNQEEGLQEYFEKELGYENGYLSPRPNNPYWGEFNIKIKPKPNEFSPGTTIDTSTTKGVLEYILLTSDARVARNLKQVTNNNAFDYVLSTKNEEVKERVRSKQIKVEAFTEYNKLTSEDKVDVMFMLGKGADSTNKEVIEDNILSLLDTEKGCSKFLNIVKDEHFNTKVKIFKYVKKGVLKKATGASGADQGYTYLDSYLGSSLKEVVGFLNNPKNDNVVSAIRSEYEEK